MKRITYRMIAFCLLLNLVGCAHKETENETAPHLTAPSNESLSIGMTFSEVSGLKGDYISFHYYVFHLNSDGHTIQIGEFGKDSGRVETITEFPAPEATPEAFTQITEGMPVTEVLRLVGVPSESATFGIDSLDFKSTAGTVFRIIWDQNQRVAEIINIS